MSQHKSFLIMTIVAIVAIFSVGWILIGSSRETQETYDESSSSEFSDMVGAATKSAREPATDLTGKCGQCGSDACLGLSPSTSIVCEERGNDGYCISTGACSSNDPKRGLKCICKISKKTSSQISSSGVTTSDELTIGTAS